MTSMTMLNGSWLSTKAAEKHEAEAMGIACAIAIGGPDISPESVKAAVDLHREKWGCDCGESDYGPR